MSPTIDRLRADMAAPVGSDAACCVVFVDDLRDMLAGAGAAEREIVRVRDERDAAEARTAALRTAVLVYFAALAAEREAMTTIRYSYGGECRDAKDRHALACTAAVAARAALDALVSGRP